jgi:hypothetical protein
MDGAGSFRIIWTVESSTFWVTLMAANLEEKRPKYLL